jgi:3-oxoacyl-[acyl-carrier-protein] synthase-3
MAVRAAQETLQVADVDPASLDLIIVATATPDYLFPATACLVQDALGALRAGAFDLAAGCTGFVYALSLAAQSIAAGAYERVLVIGSETLSRILDWKDRATCVLFGDGAGAFLLQASESPGGILASTLGADGSGGELLILPAGGSRHPTSAETVAQGLHFVQMNGPEVFRFATRVMGQAAEEAIRKAGLQLSDIDLFIPHQANLRIIQAAARHLRLPMDKVFVNLDRYGNTSSASIPIAFCEAIEQGRLKPGDHVVLVGFGAGLTWAAAVVEWVAPVPVKRPSWWRRLLMTLRYWRAAILSFWSRQRRRIEVLWMHLRGGNDRV